MPASPDSKTARLGVRTLCSVLCAALFLGAEGRAEHLHLLIPGGAGGGWDSTARGVGEALSRSGLIDSVSYENLSGGSGSRAISHLIETAERQQNTLMISSAPIILGSLRGLFPQGFRQLEPVAAVIADYGAFVVRDDSPHADWPSLARAFAGEPRSVKFAGGSARGSMDHLVAALALKMSGQNPDELRYIPYDSGGQAMVGLLSGETQVLSTGLSEAVFLAEQGEVRILATTAPSPLTEFAGLPTLIESGVEASFINWRGFFAAPGFPAGNKAFYLAQLERMYATESWQAIRAARGWTDFFIPSDDFQRFLDDQEALLDQLLLELGLKAARPR